MLSKVHRPIMSISRIARLAKAKLYFSVIHCNRDKTVVVVGTVTNDERLLEVPKMNLVALKITKEAKQRILKAGGSFITFDQLIVKNPLGTNTVLLRGPENRESLSHFGKPCGLPGGNHTRPYAAKKGRNAEAQSKDCLR